MEDVRWKMEDVRWKMEDVCLDAYVRVYSLWFIVYSQLKVYSS